MSITSEGGNTLEQRPDRLGSLWKAVIQANTRPIIIQAAINYKSVRGGIAVTKNSMMVHIINRALVFLELFIRYFLHSLSCNKVFQLLIIGRFETSFNKSFLQTLSSANNLRSVVT